MPVTVTASNGTPYHLWQLPVESSPEITDEHEFSVLRNELGGGYRSRRLLGLDTGLRAWQLTLPTLAGSSVLPNTVTDVDGSTQVSRLQYLERLFAHNRATGTPFVLEWRNQYYLVDFESEALDLARTPRIEIYNTEIELRQRRINGISIYRVERLGHNYASEEWLAQWLVGSQFNAVTKIWTGSYTPAEGSGDLSSTGGLTKLAANQHGHDIVRFDGVDAYMTRAAIDATPIREGFIVCKFREATFSGDYGLLADQASSGTVALRAANSSTIFANQGFAPTAYTYRLNGVEYPQNDQQAPMNEWGVVHFRYVTGWTWTDGYQIGSIAGSGEYAPVDIGEVILCQYALPQQIAREVTEYLMTKWGLLT